MMKFLIAILIFPLLINFSSAQQTSNQATSEEVKETNDLEPIPITEITSRADETVSNLNKIEADSERKSSIVSIEEQVQEALDSLKILMKNPVLEKLDELNLRILQNLNQEWTLYFKQLEGWKEALQGRTQELETQSHNLKELQEVWQLTSELAKNEKAPRAIRERVTSILERIKSADKKVSGRLNSLLVVQNQISQEQIKINEIIDRIKKNEKETRKQLFVIDSPPLWVAFQADRDSLEITSQIRESWTELIRANIAFVSVNENRFYIHLAIYILLIILMFYLHQQNKRRNLIDEDDKKLKASAYFVSRPFSAALLIALILSIWIYPEGTSAVADFILFLFLIPVLRLLPGMTAKEMRNPLYILFILFILDLIQRNAFGFLLLQRILLLTASITALATLMWILRTGSPLYRDGNQFWFKLVRKSSPVLILIMLTGLIGNLVGSVSLASTLAWGLIKSGYILVVLYITSIVSTGLITILIRRRRKRASQFVKAYADRLERWAFITINFIIMLIWVRITLNTFGFLAPFMEWFDEALSKTWTVGTMEISVNAIFDFLMIVIFTFVIARFIRIILDMEIFPRIKLPRGIPGAISMVVRYTFVAVGIILALSSLGIDLGKFGLLAGALGVGLGFGLQNIIANFVSGIILAFERPVQVGDTVQMDKLFGNVQSIGVRSSTVKTFDGSEVIVPNADLISNRVTNWTLSDTRRRMELPVKVAYGNDPHQVLELILKVAQDHQDVLEDPAPFAIFNGFGDYFLDFTLYYYIYSQNFFKAKSEVALGVHDLIKSKGIDTPRPQRDIRMTTTDKPPAKKTTTRRKPGTKTDFSK
jgi:small-conductance mechanosensitive channel